jgi:beta-glucosidase
VTEVATPPTIYEQIAITTGADYWSTAGFPTAGLRSLRLADGPHGLRIQDDENPDHLGLGRSLPATCFPPAVTLASSWDLALVREVADALGREARSHGVDVLLGPGMNIKRSPLCGRNFEYFSEDPMLSGLLAAAVVEGLQSNRVAACVKHFAANNQETDRQRVSAEIDERTLREIYLRTFQIVIREANPWSIMSAYNKINGVYASENHWLLTDLLRGEWGYDGVVVSDWGAVHDPVEAVEAGTDLRMPGRPEDDRLRVAEASGQLDHQALANTAQRVALLAERTTPDNSEQRVIDLDQHHELTRRAAAESAVLLINEGTLPLNLQNSRRLAVIGELARTPRYQGAGSSAVNPTRVITGLDALTRRAERFGATIEFAAGYALDAAPPAPELIAAAREAATAADVAVVFLGLPGQYEAEGRDRSSIDLPDNQLALLKALAETDTPTVVALSNGSAVTTTSWRADVNAIVEFWLTGQAHGDTIADVLLGTVNPSGKLAETVPVRLADTPAYLDFPGEHSKVRYSEGIHVGYRYYDARSISVDYPFGHGLSYTTFEYSDLEVTIFSVDDLLAFTADITVTNIGPVAGAEVVQLYVSDHANTVQTPPQELRRFTKVRLQRGQSQRVSMGVKREDLEHFSTAVRAWIYEGGPVTVMIGSSSRDIRATADVEVPGRRVAVPLTVWSTFREWREHPTVGPQLENLLASRGGIRGRMADLLSDETGQDSVLDVPLQTLLEFPGVPLTADDAQRLTAETA